MARRRRSRRWPARWRPRPCIGGDTSAPRPGSRRQEAAQQQRHAAWVATYEAIHTLRAQGTPVTTIAAAARDQPSHRVRVPAADPAPESAQPAAVRPGVAAVHDLSDPALARGVHGQHAALARDAGAGLCALRADRLALHHAAAAGERRGLGPRDADLALHPSAGAVGPRRLVHLGVPRSEAGAGRAAVCGPTDSRRTPPLRRRIP